jgi:hypothetical protein
MHLTLSNQAGQIIKYNGKGGKEYMWGQQQNIY